ncbi:suppressor of fused domain protein [Pedobacter sp. ASV28]|uniref:suppressor of fused domain protein n=1 Tax=Pedobacter sp. ASV28 TaxID=2795123 RepID=UPI0018EA8F7D|nr:suppressor of fused domain protein [Pedobacter sp. ASV28]
MTQQEKSESGIPIYRYHNLKPKNLQLSTRDVQTIEQVSNHIEKHLGQIDSVFHEIISDLVHIDVHWVKPSSKFPFHILVTSGMSDRPMTVPKGLEAHKYAEICILLPLDWNIDIDNYQFMHEAFKDENNYWPIRWLKTIARFPHEYDTWISWGHTIPNGENAALFAEGTKLGCMVLYPALSLPQDFFELNLEEEKIINFYCLYPLYPEEMELKLRKGSEALLNKFEEFGVSDIIAVNRPNTCSKRKLFGWR